jgi:transcriptional regulator with XRE-family HTH domain
MPIRMLRCFQEHAKSIREVLEPKWGFNGIRTPICAKIIDTMSSLQETGKDFQVFGRNVRAHRRALGLRVKDLARDAGIGLETLRRIESGHPCFPSSQQKITRVLSVTLDSLWKSIDSAFVYHFHEENTRWAFFDTSQAAHWGLNEEREKLDPGSIQEAAERHRLGHFGLSDAFVRRFRCQLPNGFHGAVLIEVYHQMFTMAHRHFNAMGYFCLRGKLRFTLKNGEEKILKEGELLVIDSSMDGFYEPFDPVGPKDLPPLVFGYWINAGLATKYKPQGES